MLCAASALTVSLPTLRNGFAIDDIYVFVDQPSTHDLRNIPSFFAGGWGMGTSNAQERALNTRYYRPVATTLGALEYATFGLRPAGFHLVSALLHAATAALVVLLLWQVTAGNGLAVLLGGLLFAIHPAQTEAFCAACYQTTLLAGCFGTLALLFFGRALTEKLSWSRLFGMGASLCCALLSKEEAFAVPLLAAAWVVALRPPGWRQRLLAGAIAMGLPVLGVLLLRHAFLTPSRVTYFADAPAHVVALTMVRVVSLYLELLVTPLRFCPFYDWFIIGYETTLSRAVLTGALVLGMAVTAAWFAGRRAPLVTLAVSWLLLGLLPVSQIVPIIVVAAERFLYLPMLGWSLLAGLGLARVLAWGRARGRYGLVVVAMSLLFFAYAARTVARVPDWRNDETLNLATAAYFPETPGPYLNLATYYVRFEQNPRKALAALAEADKRVPGWKPARDRADEIRATMTAP